MEIIILTGLIINTLWFLTYTFFASRILDYWRESLTYSKLHWENREEYLSAIESFDKGYAQGKKETEEALK